MLPLGPWNEVVAASLIYQMHGSTHVRMECCIATTATVRPTSKSIFEYLWYARYFERLACVLSDEQIKGLLRSQAETCRRLAVKNGREALATVILKGHKG